MRLLKFRFLLLAIIISCNAGLSCKAYAEFDPRLKALGLMAGYGTAGGALLGAASMAFGSDGRSIFKGMSLGLYAGLLFGGFIVVSHAIRKHQAANPDDDYYPDTEDSPYEEGYDDEYEEEGDGEEADEENRRWNPYWEQRDQAARYGDRSLHPSRHDKYDQVYYMNIINISF